MTQFPGHRLAQRWLGTLLLAALFARAWVPAGFMPTAGHPLQLAFCHAGMVMPGAESEPGKHGSPSGHFESCPFGSAPATAPVIAPAALATTPALVMAHQVVDFQRLRSRAVLAPAHRSRAPPTLA